jgi:hypothetical protein
MEICTMDIPEECCDDCPEQSEPDLTQHFNKLLTEDQLDEYMIDDHGDIEKLELLKEQ